MKIYKFLTIVLLTCFLTLYACTSGNEKHEKVWSDVSEEVTSLSDLKQTVFVATLENPVPKNKNSIYAPAFLYAWDKIKTELKSPISINDSNSADFILLNASSSHQNSLTNDEYSATAELVDGVIIARAFFNKTLPFEPRLQANIPLTFDTTAVAAFGMYYYDPNITAFSEILYYKDDNTFILKLSPKDKQHEILLVKGLSNYKTLLDALKRTNDLIAKGKQERTNIKIAWKYEILPEDIFIIPAIQFNIATHYEHFEGQHFFTKDHKKHVVEEAYQPDRFYIQ